MHALRGRRSFFSPPPGAPWPRASRSRARGSRRRQHPPRSARMARRRPRGPRPGPPREGLPGGLLPQGAPRRPRASPRDRGGLRAARRGDRRGGALGQPARPRRGGAGKNIATVTEGLALAEAVGARCCVDIAGSFSATSWFGPHPDNLSPRFFDAAVENARAIIDAVKPSRTTFGYEMMAWSLPDSPDAALRMSKRWTARPSPSTSTPATSSTPPSATTARARSSASATRSSAPGSRACT